MRRFGRTVLAAVLASTMAVSPVLAAPTVNELKESVEEAEGQVSEIQSELQTLVEKINKLEEDLIQKGEDIQAAEAELTAAQKKEKKQYEDMKLRIKYMYESDGSNVLEILLSATSFSDFLNKAEYISDLHTYDRNMLDVYTATREQIEDLKAQLEKEQADMQQMQEEYKQEEENLNETLVAKQAEVADLSEQLEAAVKAAEEKARQEAEAKRKAEEEAQRQQQAAQSGGSASAASAGDSDSGSSASDSGSDSSSQSSYTPPANSGGGAAIVAAAQSWLGVPYVYGGSSRSGVDCSGLVMNVHAAVGISTARTSGSIGAGGVPVSDPLPGDVVCYAGHVGIYVGDGMMIHAPVPGDVVRYGSIDYAPHWFRRYW